MFIYKQKINFILLFFLEILERYCKPVVLGNMCKICTTKENLSTCRKRLCLFSGKKANSSPMFFWRYCRDMQTSFFGYFGQTCLQTRNLPKTLMYFCRPKIKFIIPVLLEILHFKESWNLIEIWLILFLRKRLNWRTNRQTNRQR